MPVDLSFASFTQTEHFFSGFIREPFLHLKALENSSEFDKVPMTLFEIKKKNYFSILCLLVRL